MKLLVVTSRYDTLVDSSGKPFWLTELQLELTPGQRTAEAGELAIRVTDAELEELTRLHGLRRASIRSFVCDPKVSKAVAHLRHRETYQFDPKFGDPLVHTASESLGHDNRQVFPRLDPAVIGIVELKDQRRILLGRNAQRPAYFSLIAGYVGLGETLEAAFEREVREETGRGIYATTYLGSQPWPISGSLMMGFHAFTSEEEPSSPTDGELAEIVWATAKELEQLPLPQPGSMAHQLIRQWALRNGTSAMGLAQPKSRG